MKFILFADLHFHPHEVMAVSINGDNSRLLDSIDVLSQIKEHALQTGITNIACLGDFFHTRKKIDVDIYDRAYSLIEDYKTSGLTLYLLAGNHDLYYRNTSKVTSLRPLSRFAYVVNQPAVINVPNGTIAMIPYFEKTDMLIDCIKNWKSDNPIFFLHAEYLGALRAKTSKEAAKRGIDASIFPSNTRAVFMGHYHMRQPLTDKITYLGSPLQITTREILEEKYFYEFDTDTLQLTPIKTRAAKFAVVDYPSETVLRYCDPNATLEEAVTGNYVEVKTHETIKKTSTMYKVLQKSRNYILTTKAKKQDNVVKGDVDLQEIDIESLCDQYQKDHPHEYLTEDFLRNVRQKITQVQIR